MGTTRAGVAVLLTGESELVDVPLRGRSLRAHAREALGAAGLEVVPQGSSWGPLAGAHVPVVVHDPLCPLTPAAFIGDLLGAVGDEVLVGSRPVTDTIKRVADGVVGATVDRSLLVAVTAPVVLPASLVAGLAGPVPTDAPSLVEALRQAGHPVRFVEAPAESRRVVDESDIALLEELAAESTG